MSPATAGDKGLILNEFAILEFAQNLSCFSAKISAKSRNFEIINKPKKITCLIKKESPFLQK